MGRLLGHVEVSVWSEGSLLRVRSYPSSAWIRYQQ